MTCSNRSETVPGETCAEPAAVAAGDGGSGGDVIPGGAAERAACGTPASATESRRVWPGRRPITSLAQLLLEGRATMPFPTTPGRRAGRSGSAAPPGPPTLTVRAPRASRALAKLAALSSLVAFAPGCMTSNAYTTPRAIEPGKVTMSAATEVSFVADGRRGPAGLPDRVDTRLGVAALPPAVSFRIGAGAGVDVGLSVRSGFVPGVDVKYNFYQSNGLDLAVRPALQGFAVPGGDSDRGVRAWVHADLPLMAGLRLGERTVLVASPGVAYAAKSNLDGPAFYPNLGAAGRLGLGVHVAFSRDVALFPEVTAMQSFDDRHDVWVSGGIGLVAGSLPGGRR